MFLPGGLGVMVAMGGRLLQAAVVGGLVMGVVALPVQQAAVQAAELRDAAVVADVPTALAVAHKFRHRVEVTGQETPSSRVYAEPAGHLSTDLFPFEFQVKRGDGWARIDTTLDVRPDGTVAPKTSGTAMAFSGGGTDKLVSLTRNGKQLDVKWPKALPKPTLNGSTATYNEALPGVDVQVTAQAGGVAGRLVVKSKDAAANLPTTGLGAADQAALADPYATFPLVLQPNWATSGIPGWTTMSDGTGNVRASTHWMGANTDPENKNGLNGAIVARVGHTAWDSPIVTARSYFRFDTSGLTGKPIISATFNASAVWGPDCKIAANDQLWVTNRDVVPTDSWNTMPGGAFVGAANVGAENWQFGCQGHQPLGIGLGTGGGNWAINPNGLSSYWLQAANEGDQNQWRKFGTSDNDQQGKAPYLHVEWNFPPDKPTDLRTDPALPAPCRFCDGVSYVGDNSIAIKGTVNDQDGDNVRPLWAWSATVPGGTPVVDHYEPFTFLASGGTHSVTMDLAGMQPGTRVDWTLRGCDARDGCNENNWTQGLGFVVDHTPLQYAPGVGSAQYPADNAWHGGVNQPGNFTFSPGVGHCSGTGCVIRDLTAVDHYLWGWNDAPDKVATPDQLNGNVTLSIPPPGDGPRDLFVRSVSRAGKMSPITTYHFYVRSGAGPVAEFHLEGNGKDTAYLGSHDAASTEERDVLAGRGRFGHHADR